MSHNDAWNEIVNAALLGTARRQLSLPSIDGTLGRLLERIGADEDSAERALLSSAATVASYDRCGRLPSTPSIEPPMPASVSSLDRCSNRATAFLQQILSQPRNERAAFLLSEWLRIASDHGVRPPEELVPSLLDRGAQGVDETLRRAILAACAPLGRWLARLNPDWKYASEASDEVDVDEAWQTETTTARVALLERLRRDDPARARGLLESTWNDEGANDRASFIECLAIGLSPDDETFLEGALDDKRKEVRRVASTLLSKLAGSALVQRMIERTEPLLRMESGRKPMPSVELPVECDKPMIRDGIEVKPPAGVGERSWWLLQMLGTIPPSRWSRLWDTMPEALLELANKHEHRNALIPGLSIATVEHRDAEWAEAFVRLYSRNPDMRLSGMRSLDEVLALLSQEQIDAILMRELARDGSIDSNAPIWVIVSSTHHRWSPELGRAFLAAARRAVTAEQSDGAIWHLYQSIQFAGRYLPTELLREATAPWEIPDTRHYWRTHTEEMMEMLRFRSEMENEFATNHTRR